ncbi:Pentatricopeptide repeat-containing protein [Artemisia annua]|uniref:Pentatricopeptide repeat-containing protein n=1 Tax=Artemisia annua TaxID=35608 RepID=A0A2U1MY62_ARTAN|nr:Pentatricopeptide repeat-containing protein [Artemisia annua]
MEHYGCLVDMYGRAGMIKEAYRVIKNMSMEPSSIMLRSFIRAELLRDQVDDANHVLSGNMSSLSGYWNEVDDARVAMKGILCAVSMICKRQIHNSKHVIHKGLNYKSKFGIL